MAKKEKKQIMVCGELNRNSDSLRADRVVEDVNWYNLGLFKSVG